MRCTIAADLKAGETLLVLGAAGGVGLAAVELGKARGARVIAAVSSEEKGQAARDAGADQAIVYPRGPFDKDSSKALASQFKEAVGPTGADVIYDPVGGDYAEAGAALDRVGGALSGCRLSRGDPQAPAQPDPAQELRRARRVLGRVCGTRSQGQCRACRASVCAVGRGQDRPRVSATYPLASGGEAIAALAARRVIGKVVVEL